MKVIHAEMELIEIYKGQPLFRDVRKYLEDRGFSLYGFTSFERYSCDGIFVSGPTWRRTWVFPFYNYFWKYVFFAGRKLRVTLERAMKTK